MLSTRVCFPDHLPDRFDAQMPAARWSLVHARRHPGGEDLTQRVSGLDLSSLEIGDCIDYVLDLAQVADKAESDRSIRMVQDDLYISPDYWLWKPIGGLERVTLTASFELPDGMAVAVPWPKIDRSEVYQIPESTFEWTLPAAFGRFSQQVLAVDTPARDARLRVSILGDEWNIPLARLHEWIDRSAQAVTRLGGEFPVDRAQVILLPYPGDAVGFGCVDRGGGCSVVIQVGVEASDQTLIEDWVAVHELLHLGTPVTDVQARWLTEGLSTYYEPLLRAKAGIISPRRAWETLHDGFLRGSARGTDRTLLEESRDMDETRQYWRVYWAGAGIALISDVAARVAGSSLDHEILAIRDCCLNTAGPHSFEHLLGKAPASDESRAPHLRATVDRYVTSKQFPDYQSAYRVLGLSFDGQGRVTLSNDTDARALREQMTGPERALPE